MFRVQGGEFRGDPILHPLIPPPSDLTLGRRGRKKFSLRASKSGGQDLRVGVISEKFGGLTMICEARHCKLSCERVGLGG